jgi:hypothetical protein
MPSIPVSFDALKQYYPRRPDLTPELKKFMDGLNKGIPDDKPKNTPCCVQVSHALNMAGQSVTQTYVHQRRNNSPITISGTVYYYVLAVDEMEKYLSQRYGAGELLTMDKTAKPSQAEQFKAYLQGRQGVLVFRDGGAGFHTELWNGQNCEQSIANHGDITQDACLAKPRVLFWDCGPPKWLTDYMNTQPP